MPTNTSVGASNNSSPPTRTPKQALGDKAVEIVAAQLGSIIKGRRYEHAYSVARLAEAHARGKEVRKSARFTSPRMPPCASRTATLDSDGRRKVQEACLRFL